MRVAALLAGLIAATPAHAGGVGPLVLGGFHTERVAYYSSTRGGGAGDPPYADPAEYPQYLQTQLIPNVGAGLELVLGDRDDLIQGVFRGYWLADFPQQDPAKKATDVDASVIVANWREGTRHVGVGTVGLNFGVFRAASNKFKLSVGAHLGSGFLTTDHTEFLQAQGGLNASYLLSRTLEWYIDASYSLRVRKEAQHGAFAISGIRVMFD